MKNLFTLKRLKIVLAAFFILTSISSYAQILKIHYLGHSAFVLEFDNGVTVVTDYGKPNAWLQWGWDSPIKDIGNLFPDVMTYSHTNHEDHYDPSRIPEGIEHILMENDTLIMEGLSIKPIRVCENNTNNEDNSAFLFSYKGFKFLHLGDAQAQIKSIKDPTIADHIKEIIPDSLDLLFMTIEGPTKFIQQTEAFVDLVKPKRIIPMHYWSDEYLHQFIDYLTLQNDSGKTYQIQELSSSKYELNESNQSQPIEVITLIRSAYNSNTGVNDNFRIKYGFKLEQNYPNPFNPTTTIKLSIPSDVKYETRDVRLTVYNSLEQRVAMLVNEKKPPGNYEVLYDASNLPSGIYLYKLISENRHSTNKMLLLK